MKNLIDKIEKVDAATWTRLALLAAALINNALEIFGYSLSQGRAGEIFTVIFTVFAALCAYWKNNSFTHAAIEADEYMKNLRSIRR